MQMFQNELPGKRALVLKSPVVGLELTPIRDYFDLIILENDQVLTSVSRPDIIMYQDPSPYRNSVMYFDKYFNDQGNIFVINYSATEIINSVANATNYYGCNFIPSSSPISTAPSAERKVACGLNQDTPGVHLAKIFGCTTIYYDYALQGTAYASLSTLQSFMAEKDTLKPKNLIGTNRKTLLEKLI